MEKIWKPTHIYALNNTIETQIDENYCVELGTYLPMKKRIEDLKQAGIDLLAYRQAYSTFANGTETLKVEDIEMSELTDDEIDIFNKKQMYLERFKAEAEAKKQAEIERQNTIQEKARKFDEMQKNTQKTTKTEQD